LRDSNQHIYSKVIEFVTALYENILTTVAFQTALTGGFFGELERANIAREKDNKDPIDTQAAFDVFMADVNRFFTPASSRDFRKHVDIFQGTLGDDIGEWKITPSASTFRRVVYRGEMQPAQWPKYKYLLLELWRATGTDLETSLCRQRDIARQQIFNSLEREYQKEFSERNMRRLDTLIPTEVTAIRDEAYDAFGKFLRNLGWKASEIPSKKTLIEAAVQTEDASEAPVVANEGWAVAEITVPNADET
jgi:hypothetical protein